MVEPIRQKMKRASPIKFLCKCGWWSTQNAFDIPWHERKHGCTMGAQLFKKRDLDPLP